MSAYDVGVSKRVRMTSHRAVWRVRLVAFRVFQSARAPKRSRPPTEQSGECARAASDRAARRVRMSVSEWRLDECE